MLQTRESISGFLPDIFVHSLPDSKPLLTSFPSHVAAHTCQMGAAILLLPWKVSHIWMDAHWLRWNGPMPAYSIKGQAILGMRALSQ